MKSLSLNRLSLFLIAAAFAASPPSSAEEGPIALRSDFSRFHQKVRTEGKAHVVFLGGSITENKKGHTAMIPQWLQEQYPDAEFTFTNAGLSSTCSVSAAFRLPHDVLAEGPVDLLVVEFAVNDDQDAGHDQVTAIRGMEGIIGQVRTANPSADILMVHYVNPHLLEKAQAGQSSVSIAAHEAVAAHWDITTVNVAKALAASTREGTMDWKRYGGVHPKQDGYRFASDFMIEALSQGLVGNINASQGAHSRPAAPLDEGSFDDISPLDLQQIAWLGSWRYGAVGEDLLPVGSIRESYRGRPVLRSEEPGAMLYVDFRGQALTTFVLAGPDTGSLEVSVDGGKFQPVSLFHRFSKGLNYPRTVVLAEGLGDGFHQVAIRISDQAPLGSQGSAASFLSFGINH